MIVVLAIVSVSAFIVYRYIRRSPSDDERRRLVN